MPTHIKLIKEKVARLLPILKEKYKLKSIGVFGSYVRNAQREGSDVDILVSFSEKPGFFKYIELENYLSDALQAKVDLVMQEALKPNIGRRILKEVEML